MPFCDGLNRCEIWEWLLFSIPVFSGRWVWNNQKCHIQTQGKIRGNFDLKHITEKIYLLLCSPTIRSRLGFPIQTNTIWTDSQLKYPKSGTQNSLRGTPVLEKQAKTHWCLDSEIKCKIGLELKLQFSNIHVMVQMETQHHEAVQRLGH